MNYALEQLNHFESLYEKHGDSVKSLDWNEESQRQRFNVLCQIGDLHGRSVLDVGCGFGDFYKYLKEYGYMVFDYTGYDLMLPFITKACLLHPDGKFSCGNFLTAEIERKFDYVIGSGIFALKFDNWWLLMRSTVQKMFSVCKKGVGVNFLSSHSPNQNNPNAAYVEPVDVLRMLMAITDKVVLRHNYRRNDFTVFLYK